MVECDILSDITIKALIPNEEFIEKLNDTGSAAVACLLKEASQLLNICNYKKSSKLASIARDRCWESLHTGPWRNVTEVHRDAYGNAGCIASVSEFLYFLRGEDGKVNTSCIDEYERVVEKAVYELDMVTLMSGGKFRAVANMLINCIQELETKISNHFKRRKVSPSPLEIRTSEKLNLENMNVLEISLHESPSLELFLSKYMENRVPVILTGILENWPAAQKEGGHFWGNYEYIRRVAGFRTVPVEVGGGHNGYMGPGWQQKLMTISQFIDEHIIGSGGGYLAQHELFEQIPQFKRDFMIPDYCSLLCKDEEIFDDEMIENVAIHAWFGPESTCSPCHTDPTHNILCQVVGKKEIILFAPKYTPALYPNEGLMCNTSRIDIGSCNVSLQDFPLYNVKIPRFHFVLNAGQALYIPPLWWHYIRSLEPSFSISFWWGKHRKYLDENIDGNYDT